jgi:hypothetical protein
MNQREKQYAGDAVGPAELMNQHFVASTYVAERYVLP